MKDRNVIIYGLTPASSDVSASGSAPVAIQVADTGAIYTILTLAGNGIEATPPWEAGNINNDGWRGPFVPVTSANFMVGSDGELYFSPQTRLDTETAGFAANHLNVSPLMANNSLFDAPAANTPAGVSAPNTVKVWVDTISVSIVAPAANASNMVSVILSEDPSGSATNLWQQNLKAPIDGCVTQTWKVNLLCELGFDVQCSAPGANCFTTIAVTFNDTLGVAGIYPSPN